MHTRGRSRQVRGSVLVSCALVFLVVLVVTPGWAAELRRFNMGYSAKMFPDVEAKDAMAALQIYLRGWTQELGYHSEIFLYEDGVALLRDLRSKRLDAAGVRSIEYLAISRQTPTEPTFTSLKADRKTIRYLVLVPSTLQSSSVEYLRGKRLSAIKGDDLGLLYLNTLLLRKGQPEANTFFSTVEQRVKPSQAILSAFFNQVDACVVTEGTFRTMAELNPQVGERLRVLASSLELLDTVMFVRQDLDEETKRTFFEQGQIVKSTARGRQVLTLFRTDGIARITEGELSSVRALMADHENLRSRR